MQPRELLISHAFLDWQTATASRAETFLCLRYALAFNQLDATWLDGALAPEVTYESQSVFDVLTGPDAVMEYLRGKLNTLRQNPDTKVRAELALLPQGRPCVAMFQGRNAYHANWLDQAMAATTFSAGSNGRAVRILMITTVPSPATTRRSGIYPGVDAPPTETPKRFIRPTADYQGLRFEVFLLDGQMGLDREMRARMRQALDSFPGAQYLEFNSQQMKVDEHERVGLAGFNGFPGVAAYWREHLIHTHQGLIDDPAYTEEVERATALHVVAGGG